MEYAQVPTNLLIGDYSDAEILAIVKYQMLFSSLEIEPTNKILNKFLTKKQQKLVKNYVADIKLWVQKDIEIVNKKRERNARYYQKQKISEIEQEKIKTSDKTTDGHPNKLINKESKEINEFMRGEYKNVYLPDEKLREFETYCLGKQIAKDRIEYLSQQIEQGKDKGFDSDYPNAHFVRLKQLFDTFKKHPEWIGSKEPKPADDWFASQQEGY